MGPGTLLKMSARSARLTGFRLISAPVAAHDAKKTDSKTRKRPSYETKGSLVLQTC